MGMAVWQFTIHFVPRDWAAQNRENIDQILSDDGLEFDECWRGFSVTPDLLGELDGMLPRGKHWSENEYCWKSADGDSDITIWRNEDTVSDFDIRIDLRREFTDLVFGIISFAKKHDFELFISENMEFCPAELEVLSRYISQSRAAAFVKNPRGFIRNFAQQLDENE